MCMETRIGIYNWAKETIEFFDSIDDAIYYAIDNHIVYIDTPFHHFSYEIANNKNDYLNTIIDGDGHNMYSFMVDISVNPLDEGLNYKILDKRSIWERINSPQFKQYYNTKTNKKHNAYITKTVNHHQVVMEEERLEDYLTSKKKRKHMEINEICYRTPRTTQERKFTFSINDDLEECETSVVKFKGIRGKRTKRMLPDAWDDICINHPRKSWKSTKGKQKKQFGHYVDFVASIEEDA